MTDEIMELALRVQKRYDELMRVGSHGHYETMFKIVREEVERALATAQDHRSSPPEHSDLITPKAVPGVSQAEPLQAEQEAFAAAMVAAGYGYPDRGPFKDSQFKYERDADRFAGWQIARAALQAELPAVPDALEYPKSSEGTLRCTCNEYPHAHGCGSVIGQRGWEAGYAYALATHGISASAQAGEEANHGQR